MTMVFERKRRYMFKEVRRKDREISREEAERILTEGEYGVMSTVGLDGYGYGVALSYVYYNNSIYFHCAQEGHKLENIDYNNKVSFGVVGKTKVLPQQFSTEYESAVVFGRAVFVENEEKEKALIALIDKYSPEFKTEGMEYINRSGAKTKVIKIEAERITGKAR